MLNKKRIHKITLILFFLIVLASCNDNRNTELNSEEAISELTESRAEISLSVTEEDYITDDSSSIEDTSTANTTCDTTTDITSSQENNTLEVKLDISLECNLAFKLVNMSYSEIEAEFGPLTIEYWVAGGAPVYTLPGYPDLKVMYTAVTGVNPNGLPAATGDDMCYRVDVLSDEIYPGIKVGMTNEDVQKVVPEFDPTNADFTISEVYGPYPTYYYLEEGYCICISWTFPHDTLLELERNMMNGITSQDYWKTHQFNGTVSGFDVYRSNK